MNQRGATARIADQLRGYSIVSTLDLKDDARASTAVGVAFAAVVTVMAFAAFVLDLPLDSELSGVVVTLVTVASCLVYMPTHELTHALLLWGLTRERPSIGVRLPYLVTGSQALLTRRVAVVVALGPVVLHTILLLALLVTVPNPFFLTVYIVLGLNLASSAGDVLQARGFLRLPGAALVRDDGVTTSTFCPTGAAGLGASWHEPSPTPRHS